MSKEDTDPVTKVIQTRGQNWETDTMKDFRLRLIVAIINRHLAFQLDAYVLPVQL